MEVFTYLGQVLFEGEEDFVLPEASQLFLSSSKHRAFSRHSATRPGLPLVGSLKLALSKTGLPKLKVKIGL